MKVELEDQVLTVGWRYPNPELEHQMVLHGLNPANLKKMTQPMICLTLGIKPKDLPVSLITECIILNNAKEVVVKTAVTRFYKDPHNKNKARVYALSKAINELYPTPYTEVDRRELTVDQRTEIQRIRDIRKKFWDVYNSRSQKKVPEPVPETQEA